MTSFVPRLTRLAFGRRLSAALGFSKAREGLPVVRDRRSTDDAVSAWLLSCERAAELVHATDVNAIAELEARFGFNQAGAVTHFVEQTEWGLETFPELQGGRGTFVERLMALRSKWELWEKI